MTKTVSTPPAPDPFGPVAWRITGEESTESGGGVVTFWAVTDGPAHLPDAEAAFRATQHEGQTLLWVDRVERIELDDLQNHIGLNDRVAEQRTVYRTFTLGSRAYVTTRRAGPRLKTFKLD